MPAASKVVSKELKEERDKVKFNVEEFTNWFYGGEEKVKEKRFMGKKQLMIYLHDFHDACF